MNVCVNLKMRGNYLKIINVLGGGDLEKDLPYSPWALSDVYQNVEWDAGEQKRYCPKYKPI